MLKISIAKAGDIKHILKIEQQVHKKPWSECLLLDSLKSHLFLVLSYKDKIVGYIILMQTDNEVELLNIAISSDYQKQGFAKYLLTHLKDFALRKKVSHIFLEVRESNLVAINLYQKQGFTKINLRKNYYACEAGRENALVMCLQLS